MHCRHHAAAVVWFRWGVCSVTTTTTTTTTTAKGGEKRATEIETEVEHRE